MLIRARKPALNSSIIEFGDRLDGHLYGGWAVTQNYLQARTL